MAQPPQKSAPAPVKPHDGKTPSKDDLHEKSGKDQHVPLKDPSGGREPAVVGRDIAARDARDVDDDAYPPTIGVKGFPIEDGERDPDTIAEEQRRRSAEIEAMGSEAWKAAHDERNRRELDQEPPNNTLPASEASKRLEHDKREPIAHRP